MEEFSVVIPTLNEEDNIGEVIDAIKGISDPEIIVMDDDSRDNTRDEARKRDVKVIHRKEKRDLSKSVVEGLKAASYDRVVVMDGDGQHPPKKVPEIAEKLEEDGLVIGCREEVIGNWGLHRRLMSLGAELLVKTLFKSCRRTRDPLSGFFGIDRDALDLGKMSPRGYKILAEILVLTGIRPQEVAYSFHQRQRGRSSIGISSIADFLTHVLELKYRQLGSSPQYASLQESLIDPVDRRSTSRSLACNPPET